MSTASIDDIFAQRSVPVEDIGRALSNMWRTADSAGSGGDDGAVVRSRALTLIAIAPEKMYSNTANAVNSAIAVVPARSVVVEIAERAEDVIVAEVGGTCTIGGAGGKRFCQEQVVLRADASRVRDLPSILVGLAVSDLPCVLFLPDTSQIDSDLVNRLLPILDVLVVDSSNCGDPAETFDRLLRLESAEHVIVRDLAYERARTWRDALAFAFDEAAGEDARVTAITATFAPQDAVSALLLGWIESRFSGARPFVRVKKKTDAAGEAICAIDLEVNDEQKRTEIKLRQLERGVVRLRGKDEAGEPEAPRALVDPFTALTRILADPIRDAGYDAALRAALARHAKHA
jgi:glucose-6-phosphate dehydrogenase assembly protein OpcA